MGFSARVLLTAEAKRCVAQLSFEGTVARALVHKRSISEVLLTSDASIDEHVFALGAQWPRRHFHFQPVRGCVSSSLVAETLRQATIYVAHRFYEVPFDTAFLMDRMTFDRSNLSLVSDEGPWNVGLVVHSDDVRMRRDMLSSMTSVVSFWIDGVHCATGRGELRVVPREVYSRIRASAQDERANSSSGAYRGLLLNRSAKADAWRLLPDPGDPAYFEHASDHVPGMLLMESVREIGRQFLKDPTLELIYYDARYSRFLELDEVQLEVEEERPNGDLSVVASQCGLRGMTARAKFRPVA